MQFYTGWDYYVVSVKSLRNRSANMDVLVAMGSSVAYFYSLAVTIFPTAGHHVYFETSAVIITLIKLGKMLEAGAKRRASGAIRKLMDLAPAEATRLTADGEERLPVDRLVPGDTVLVRPGDRGLPAGPVWQWDARVTAQPVGGDHVVATASHSKYLAITSNSPGSSSMSWNIISARRSLMTTVPGGRLPP